MAGGSTPRREWRALSVRQPFASLIVAGVKEYEGRSWRPAVIGLALGPVLIHASSAADVGAMTAPHIIRALRRVGLDPAALPRSQIIGMVNVPAILTGADAMRRVAKRQRMFVDVEDGEVWHVPYLWQLSDAVTLPPTVAKGALNLWRVSAEIIRKLRGDLP